MLMRRFMISLLVMALLVPVPVLVFAQSADTVAKCQQMCDKYERTADAKARCKRACRPL